MKKDTVKISMASGEQIDCPGFALRIDGHDHDFVVHKDPSIGIKFNDQWIVTHKETGMKIPFQVTAFSRMDAITYAELRMLSVTTAQFNEIIDNSKLKLKRLGLI